MCVNKPRASKESAGPRGAEKAWVAGATRFYRVVSCGWVKTPDTAPASQNMLRAHALPTLLSLVAVPNHHLHRAPAIQLFCAEPQSQQSTEIAAAADPSPQSTETAAAAAAPEPPIGLHLGVVCDKTLNPIVGYRYTRRGSEPSYDLCQTEYDKLTAAERGRYDRIDPQLTPRRALIGAGVLVLLATWLLGAPPPPPPTAREDLDEIYELPPLSPAEQLVAVFFRPVVPASQREAGRRER